VSVKLKTLDRQIKHTRIFLQSPEVQGVCRCVEECNCLVLIFMYATANLYLYIIQQTKIAFFYGWKTHFYDSNYADIEFLR